MAAKKKKPGRARRHSDAKVVECLGAWLELGDSRKAASKAGVPASSIRNWKERRPELWAKAVAAHEKAIAELRSSIAMATAKGLHLGSQRAADILESAERLDHRDLAGLIRALSEIDSTQDKIWRLNKELPTEILSLDTADEVAAALDSILAELRK